NELIDISACIFILNTNAMCLPSAATGHESFMLAKRVYRSPFRGQFRLEGRELDYLLSKCLETVWGHAAGFIEQRLAPANPPNGWGETPESNPTAILPHAATADHWRG